MMKLILMISFDSNRWNKLFFIDQIDEEATIENGKRICILYRPLIEKRMKQILITPINSTSLVTFSGNQKNNHSLEERLIERCAWNDDQVTKFINNILILEQSDKIAGKFLKVKYIYNNIWLSYMSSLKAIQQLHSKLWNDLFFTSFFLKLIFINLKTGVILL